MRKPKTFTLSVSDNDDAPQASWVESLDMAKWALEIYQRSPHSLQGPDMRFTFIAKDDGYIAVYKWLRPVDGALNAKGTFIGLAKGLKGALLLALGGQSIIRPVSMFRQITPYIEASHSYEEWRIKHHD